MACIKQGTQVSDVRVIVGKVPRLLGEIVTTVLAKEQGISVIGEAESADELLDLCARAQPDLVVLGSIEIDAEEIGRQLLRRSPNAKVVALSENGRKTFVFELRPHKVEIGELSAKELVQVVTRLLQEDRGSTQ